MFLATTQCLWLFCASRMCISLQVRSMCRVLIKWKYLIKVFVRKRAAFSIQVVAGCLRFVWWYILLFNYIYVPNLIDQECRGALGKMVKAQECRCIELSKLLSELRGDWGWDTKCLNQKSYSRWKMRSSEMQSQLHRQFEAESQQQINQGQ